jgi:hypothetical protein
MSKKSKKSLKSFNQYWAESIGESVRRKARVVRADQQQATKKSPKLDQLRKQREAAASKLPADGSISKSLDRINGQTKEQIDALRDKLIAKNKNHPHNRGITAPAPKASTLTDADKKAIAEIQKQKGSTSVKSKSKKAKAAAPKAKSSDKPSAENGSRSEEMIAALRKGSTLAALAAISGWTNHSLHGFICSRLRKQMGLNVVMTKKEGGNVYRITK